MQRFHGKFPAHASYLSPQDMSSVFRVLDKDHSGILSGTEVSEMFGTICGCPVKVHGALSRYTLGDFIRVVEDTNNRYPQFRVVENLIKYLLAHSSGPVEQDPFNLENCSKLMQIMDSDKTGHLDLSEMWNLFRFLQIDAVRLVEAFVTYGNIDSPQELQTVLREMDHKFPQLDIDGKIVTFLGSATAGGKPDFAAAPAVVRPPSDPVAKRKALLVGINYIGQQAELGGCINDVRNQMRVLTTRYGFQEKDILLLTEDQHRADREPTKANIMEGFRWLMSGAAPGDILFFQYSGHGSQTPDRTGTEADGKNECICPVDFAKGWQDYVILDDDLYKIFYEGLPPGVKCTCVFDCCHSATVADLQCTRDFHIVEDVKPRWLPPPQDIAAELAAIGGSRALPARGPEPFAPGKMLWTYSGCQDNQTSADATINGQRQGALTWAFLKALEDSNWKVSYDGLLTAAKKNLRGKYQQIPALSTTCPENFNRWYLEAAP